MMNWFIFVCFNFCAVMNCENDNRSLECPVTNGYRKWLTIWMNADHRFASNHSLTIVTINWSTKTLFIFFLLPHICTTVKFFNFQKFIHSHLHSICNPIIREFRKQKNDKKKNLSHTHSHVNVISHHRLFCSEVISLFAFIYALILLLLTRGFFSSFKMIKKEKKTNLLDSLLTYSA